MALNQTRTSTDESIFENLCLTQTSKNQSKPVALTGDGTPPYISEVSRIRIMRELYKKETQKYMDDNLRSVLKNEKITNLQNANKLKLLIDSNKSILTHMEKQRSSNGEIIKEFVKMSNSLFENRNMKGQHELLMLADASIKNLLSDIKQ